MKIIQKEKNEIELKRISKTLVVSQGEINLIFDKLGHFIAGIRTPDIKLMSLMF